uniref:Histidinol-phosphate aminotransferase n=1 Tax=Stutzerimonas stutzeri TaxID=316 RepID=HIS8_STUST|nr:RecName: Full=Histidinol-phosphate aminotransferase; AltName: Full=Imidazole acetol-phosphate transaminase [Stutzerimonas stutzeri]AAD47361.1 imidazole acetol phosphate aminotransferase [Stutzerimonas stutzeri]
MSADFLALAVPGVQKLSPYVTGKPIDELARELGIEPARIVKLASNENPLGPNPRVLEAVRGELSELTRYPDGSGFRLKAKLAERFGLKSEQITLGNGSNDIIDLVARCCGAGPNAVFSAHAFAAYPLCTQAAGAESRVVPAVDYGHDLDGMLKAIDEQTAVIFIANPNNPTGNLVRAQALESFLDRVPERVLVVLDEAYIEFYRGTNCQRLNYLVRYPNLLVSRTLSKVYGLAGLRVGYSASSPQIADVLNRVRQPFNVNSLALVAACAGWMTSSIWLKGGGWIAPVWELEQGLAELRLKWIPSRGNFLAVDLGRDAAPINAGLLRDGVIVRPIAGYDCPTFLRVSIGTEQENARFLEALRVVLDQ